MKVVKALTSQLAAALTVGPWKSYDQAQPQWGRGIFSLHSSGRKAVTNLDSISKSRDITLPTKVHIVKAVVFPVVMYGCESWTIKKAKCWRSDGVVGEDSGESLDCREMKPVNPKGSQSLIFIGRTDAEAETPVLWPPDAKNWLIGKNPDAGKDWRWEEKGMTEGVMVGWHHWLSGHEFEQALGDGGGQGSLACCSPWSHKELDTTWVTEQQQHSSGR